MAKFRIYSLYLLLTALAFSTMAYYEERIDGEYILGAMLPLHKAEGNHSHNGTCGQLSFEGIAFGEAFRLAVETINKQTSIASALYPRTFGFDLRDTCSTLQGAMDAAYSFNLHLRRHRKQKERKKPVSVVIASFDKAEYPASQLLSLEGIPQLSYIANSVKVSPPQNSNNDRENHNLLTTFPGDTLKVVAAIEAMKKLKMEYVTVVVSNDARGRSGKDLIKSTAENSPKFCSSKVHTVYSKSSAKRVVSEIGKNHLAKTVLLHLDRERSLWVLEEAKRQNLTNLIWFSTLLWNTVDLKQYREEVEGMISIGNKNQEPTDFKLHVKRLSLPYKNNNFLRSVFLELGGNKQCLDENGTVSSQIQMQCDEKHKRIKSEMLKYSPKVSHVIDAVFVYKEAVHKMRDTIERIPLIDAMKAVDFRSSMTHNIIKFSSNGVLLDVMNIIYNMQINSASNVAEMIHVGGYNYNTNPRLNLNNKIIKWKNGSKTVPASKCSPDCQKGWQRILPLSGAACCWSCVKCPNGSASFKFNSATCKECDSNSVANPSQTSCVQFKTTSFRWFDPVGEFMIFLITAGLCATFFTLGIFSQNRESDVVKSADYKMMTFMLFGLTLCFFTPVPLLLRPSTSTCVAYVIMFSFGLTIPLAVLSIKSAAVRHRFYDENMELINGSLGSMPHLVIAGVIISIQAVILAIGINVTSASVEYHPTNQWDLKYAECSYVKNTVFWVSFGYNVLISIVMNVASSRSEKMTEDYKEQKWICLTTCGFYLVSYLFITCIYSVYGSNVVEAASVIIVLFGFTFIIMYFAPKLRLILFGQKPKQEYGPDGKSLIQEEDTEQKPLTTHMSGVEGLKKHKVLGVKVKEESSRA